MNPKSKIIIKKVRKTGHGGAHGGSWKVAYADFVTAMMAFFLLMWLITMVSPEKRARVASYFKQFSLFEKSGSSFLMEQQVGVTGEGGGKEFGKTERDYGKGAVDVLSPEALKEKLKKEIEKKLADVKEQVMVDVFEEGVRIQIVDTEGRPMFPLGGTALTTNAKKILAVLSGTINALENKITIEGHTDALSYASDRYTNWELSTERASAARQELQQNGLDPDRLVRVSGYAATQPLIREDAHDPRNRRISIILHYPADPVQREKVQQMQQVPVALQPAR